MSNEELIDFFTAQLTFQKKLATNLPKAPMIADNVQRLKELSQKQRDLAQTILDQLNQPELSQQNDDFIDAIRSYCETYTAQKRYVADLAEFLTPKVKGIIRFKDLPTYLTEMIQKQELERLSLSEEDNSSEFSVFNTRDSAIGSEEETSSSEGETRSMENKRPSTPVFTGAKTFFTPPKPKRKVEEPLKIEILLNNTLKTFIDHYDQLLTDNTNLKNELGLEDSKNLMDEAMIEEMVGNPDKPMSTNTHLKHKIEVVSKYCLLLEKENKQLQADIYNPANQAPSV